MPLGLLFLKSSGLKKLKRHPDAHRIGGDCHPSDKTKSLFVFDIKAEVPAAIVAKGTVDSRSEAVNVED